MENKEVQILKDGRVYIDYGPVSMVIKATKDSKDMTELCVESFKIIKQMLSELGQDLPILKNYPKKIRSEYLKSEVSLRMLEAVNSVGEETLTPMATVAGVISDKVADWIYSKGVDKVIVNNGGDIALRLSENQSVIMKISPDINKTSGETIVLIRGEDGIGGVCTSGLGGRSFTRGIANSVTVFAENCTIADACATHIANTSYIESTRVHQALASTIHQSSDIADLMVVTEVEPLTEDEILQGIENIKKETIHQMEKNNLKYLIADIQGKKLIWPPKMSLIV